MPLITREEKGSKLTIAEMDGNLEYLQTTMSGSITLTGPIDANLSTTEQAGIKTSTSTRAAGLDTITTNRVMTTYNTSTYGTSSIGVEQTSTSGSGMANGNYSLANVAYYYTASATPSITQFSGKAFNSITGTSIQSYTNLSIPAGTSFNLGIYNSPSNAGILGSPTYNSGSIVLAKRLGITTSALYIDTATNGVNVASTEANIFTVQKLAGGNATNVFKINQSGSMVVATTSSAAPTWTGVDGEIIPATVSGMYLLYMWMNGAWRSGSFV